jgi:hypothetical protein
MTLFIQRADRRDTLAVHAKLDELLKATHEARTELAAIDEQEPEDIEKCAIANVATSKAVSTQSILQAAAPYIPGDVGRGQGVGCEQCVTMASKSGLFRASARTARDTTKGRPSPLGSRGAMMADRVGVSADG